MDPTHVAAILAALAAGDDPFTGIALPVDSQLRDPRIRAALAAAAEALDPDMALAEMDGGRVVRSRGARAGRTVGPNTGSVWSLADQASLVERFDRGEPAVDIAAALGRTRGAIRSRLVYLGLNQVVTERGDASFLKHFEAGHFLRRVIDEAVLKRAEVLLNAVDPAGALERLRAAVALYRT